MYMYVHSHKTVRTEKHLHLSLRPRITARGTVLLVNTLGISTLWLVKISTYSFGRNPPKQVMVVWPLRRRTGCSLELR